MNYVQLTARDREEMLRTIGVNSFEDLLVDVPEEIRFRGRLDIPDGLSEQELQASLKALATRNRDSDTWPSFLGAGLYDHHVPVVVDPLVQRGEFLTSYTPYQAEASQGTLQAIFEFQTMVATLTGMEVANASMYDGGTALAEAVFMGLHGAEDRKVVILSEGIHPLYRRVVETYLRNLPGIEIKTVPLGRDGRTLGEGLHDALASFAGAAVACFQSPNFFGVVEDLAPLLADTKGAGALAVAVTDLVACAVMEPPGALGADVVVGEGQSAGVPFQFGGPGYGFFAVRKPLVRRMPGRLAGLSVDADGERAFTLTLSTREQHIRRAKATSNICTNTGLMALRGCIHLTAMGPEGLREVATHCMAKSAYAARKIAALPGWSLRYKGPILKEFTVRCPVPAARAVEAGRKAGIVAGLDLGRVDPARTDELLVAVTERRTRAEIDALVAALATLGGKGASPPRAKAKAAASPKAAARRRPAATRSPGARRPAARKPATRKPARTAPARGKTSKRGGGR